MEKKRKPMENHKTAAWAGVKLAKDHSKVPVPPEEEVIQAKEYVDRNEK